VVLVGMMATGKTTVGRAVAERLGRPFLDSDDLIERRTGRTVREIFESDGEQAFRALESQVLREALSGDAPAVIAAAGGAVLDAENRRWLKRNGTVVWLRAEPSVLARRIGADDHRPLLAVDPDATLRRLHAERLPLYREVADVVVDVDGLVPGEVVDRVAAEVTP
jgi:shikimate kinase